MFEKRTVEASSAYVHSINTYFYASAADEEGDITTFTTVAPPVDGMHTVMQGTVTSIPENDEFRIMAGTRILTVEVDEMSYNPLDDEGYQKIEVGDRVNAAESASPSFSRMCARWASTVRGLMPRLSPMVWTSSPRPIRSKTSNSRSLRLCMHETD